MAPMNPIRHGLLFYAGSAALLCVMLVEAIAVIGRHVGVPVTGALEIVQAAMVPAACAAMLIATLQGAHAAVHMLLEKLAERSRRRFERGTAILAALFFAAMGAGAGWLGVEYWNSYEQSEVLHIPFRPLRLLVSLTGGALAAAFVYRAFRQRKQP